VQWEDDTMDIQPTPNNPDEPNDNETVSGIVIDL
jgi:hypothetical protein